MFLFLLQSATQVRIGGLLGGLPQEVPVMILNRQCSSGMCGVKFEESEESKRGGGDLINDII